MVYVCIADGFEEIEALTVVDILRRACIETSTVSVMDQNIVEGAHGIPVVCDEMFDDVNFDDCEMLVLPGGMPGSANLYAHSGLASAIKKFRSQGKWLAAICAAPGVVLGQLGVLDGEKAVCYPGFESDLQGAAVCKEAVMVSGKIITSRGPGTAGAFALQIVSLLESPEKAAELKSGMLYQ